MVGRHGHPLLTALALTPPLREALGAGMSASLACGGIPVFHRGQTMTGVGELDYGKGLVRVDSPCYRAHYHQPGCGVPERCGASGVWCVIGGCYI